MNDYRQQLSPLDNIKIAAPCHASWADMMGNERVRFCNSCTRNVYNISEMSKKEAEQLIANAEGRLCLRFYQRKDGTVITDDCPVGLRAVRRLLYQKAAALVAIFSWMLLSGCDKVEWKLRQLYSGNRWSEDVSINHESGLLTLDGGLPSMGEVGTIYDVPLVPVTVAKTEIRKGTTISLNSIEARDISLGNTKAGQIVYCTSAVRKKAKRDIKAGQPISIDDIDEEENTDGIKVNLPPEEQEKLAIEAKVEHKKPSGLVKSWVVQRLHKLQLAQP